MKHAFAQRGAAAAFALAALIGLAAAPASAGTAQAAGACKLLITSTHPQILYSVRIVNSCAPRAAGDRLVQSIYYGADWPDPDDWLFDRKDPALTDNFVRIEWDVNEDRETRDEVYTRNRFVRPDGSIYEIRSNEVREQFHPLRR